MDETTRMRTRSDHRGRVGIAVLVTASTFVALWAFDGFGGFLGLGPAVAHEYQYPPQYQYGQGEARVTTIEPICRDFATGGAAQLPEVVYTVRRDGKIGGLDPWSIRYWTRVRAPAASFTIEVAQTTTHPTFRILFDLAQTGQIRLHEASCQDSTLPQSISFDDDQAKVTISGATPGAFYILSVRYGTQPFLSKRAPNPSTVHYDFQTKVNGALVDSDPNGLDLKKR